MSNLSYHFLCGINRLARSRFKPKCTLKPFQPHPALRPYVKFYWYLEPDYGKHEHRLFPGQYCDLIIQIGPPANYKKPNRTWRLRSVDGFIEGHWKSYFFLRFSDACRLVGVRFKSTGLYHFVRTPVKEFVEQFEKGFMKMNRIQNSIVCLIVGLTIFILFLDKGLKASWSLMQELTSGKSNLSTVAIRVHHMDAMVAFYTEAFGIRFRDVDTFGLASKFGEIDGITLKFVPLRKQADFEDYPSHQLGFNVADVEAVIALAQKHGGRQEGDILREGDQMQGAIRDSDGNTIELYSE